MSILAASKSPATDAHISYVYLLNAELKANGEKKANKFIQCSVQSCTLVNMFIVLNTHLDTETGFLQYSGGQQNLKYIMASKVIENFRSEDLPVVTRTVGGKTSSGC
jgi:hypothetical protein